MVFDHHLVVPVFVIVAMIVNSHLLESVLQSLHLLGCPLLDHVSFDLLLAVLTKIVNLVAIGVDFQFLEVVEDVAKVLDGVGCVKRKDGNRWRWRVLKVDSLNSIDLGTHGRVPDDANGRSWLLWITIARSFCEFLVGSRSVINNIRLLWLKRFGRCLMLCSSELDYLILTA
jgi:hypothetical protein